MPGPLIDVTLNQIGDDGVQTVFAISPFGASETRAERLARLYKMGILNPDCGYCAEGRDHPTLNAFMPSHTASTRCQSGRRNHCTCDTCF